MRTVPDEITSLNEETLVKRSIWNRFKNWIIHLNIYHEESTLIIDEQRLATRINVITLTFTLILLIFIRTFSPQTTIVSVQSPSSSQFQELIDTYASTLSCPCSKVIFPYESFLSFSPEFHQICSSHFVSSSWIQTLFFINMSRYHPLDFRNSASPQFQLLALFCRFAVQAVSNALDEFSQENFVNSHAISPKLLDVQINASIQHLQSTVVANAMRMDKFITLAMENNRLESTLQTNYVVISVPGDRVYYTSIIKYLKDDYKDTSLQSSYCSCETSSNCTFPAAFYTNYIRTSSYYQPTLPFLFVVPGHFVGCLPRSAILRSTLECFYNQRCLNILDMLGIETTDVVPLNRSIDSRFSSGTTIQTMFNELFVEKWNYKNNFDNYFRTCAPMTCSYTYVIRLNVGTMFGSIISLLGGLIVIFRLGAYIFVAHVLRKLNKMERQVDVVLRQRQPSRNLRENLLHGIRKLKDTVLHMNLFKDTSILSNVNHKRWATRIYIVLLMIGFSILTIYASINRHTITVVIKNPSRNDFESLHAKYSLTLVCPCSQLSVLHSDLIHIEVQFHPICLSDFIREDRWFLYFNFQNKNNMSTNFVSYSQDFRFGTGYSFFLLLRTLCRFANDTVQNSLTVFKNTQFISNEALPETNFKLRINAIAEKWKDQTSNSFLSLFSLVRTMIEDNQLHVSTDTNIAFKSTNINNVWLLTLNTRSYESENRSLCYCLLNSKCLLRQGFFCKGVACQGPGKFPNQTIPGLYLSCFPFNALLLSTLECFYDALCIQMLLDWRLFEINDIYEPIQLNIKPLEYGKSKNSSNTEPIDHIVSRLFVDEWKFSSKPIVHYQQCNPTVCTYSYISDFEPVYVITTVIGLLGGLSIILRFLVPIVFCIVVQHRGARNRHLTPPTTHDNNLTQTTLTKTGSIHRKIQQSIRTVDFFPERVKHSVWATRLYILMFVFCFFIVLISTALGDLNFDIAVQSPSQSTFIDLYRSHSSHRLTCRCSQSSITYRSFFNLSVRYHQVCSSFFVTMDWWILVISNGYELIKYFDQALLSNHFRMLSSFCRLSRETLDEAINALLADSFISIETMTPDDFYNQVDSTLKSFIKRATSEFINSIDYIADMFRSNQLEHLFLSNWMISFSTAAENYVLSSTPRSYNNNTCNCASSMNNSCWWSLKFRQRNETIMSLLGFVGGCLPVDGLQLSTLQCLYDDSCLQRIRSLILPSKQSIFLPPLKANVETRFSPDITLVNTMLKELFVEEWSNQSNYSMYYNACAPRTCRYSYSKRSPASYVVTTFFGIYGGVTMCLRMLILAAFKLVDVIQSHRNE